ncbi:MAG: relaxase/mobilization nuclease domain-containing protein [Saprospiraceae bacterium]|uniref:relaxase/mobilization nuclease domain-containing protein n=1 Tax=Candidatus Brachybacter algidus TaxID=2982024 RepID=UPI00257AADC4|nr:relaxase/mobilization nuclease domain-containing protein [Candidatus Brachybacter algidus]MBK7605662.1 relaxase/mobilization nuclease domain-containing protein [Candidatus Brachybacter algidus]
MKKICEEYGIGLRTQKSAEYEHVSVVSAHDKEKSWTERIKQRVDTVLESATSYTDFEKQLEERGISCEQKQFTDRKTGKTQDYLLFSYWDEEKGKERKIKNTTLGSRFRNERLQSCFAQNLRQQVLRQPAIAPEPIKGSRAPVSAPIQVNTPDKKQEALNEQKQAIFNDTREKLREAASQEEVERIKREEELKQELVDREKEIQAKQEVDHKRRMALLRRGLER